MIADTTFAIDLMRKDQKAIDKLNELTRRGAIVSAYDPFLNENIVTERFKTTFYAENNADPDLDGVVVAVEHDSLKEKIAILQKKYPVIRLKEL